MNASRINKYNCPQCGVQQKRPGRCVKCKRDDVHLPTVCTDCGKNLRYDYDPDDPTPMCEACWMAYR